MQLFDSNGDGDAAVGSAGRPSIQAASLAAPAASGHFDELRGHAAGGQGALTASWAQFFDHLGSGGIEGLDRRMAALRRQIDDNGVTYNVHADNGSGAQRAWSLDLFPLILEPADWQQIERGVQQRIRVLDRVMADVYGAQRLLASGLLPPALVQGHPGYLREMNGVTPAVGRFLHLAAFDLARDASGLWWVVSQRTQAPSGLGYLLENRLAIARQFPRTMEHLQVQRLASTYSALVEGLKLHCAALAGSGRDPLIALLTPGPANETYFEHAWLARYLGLTLVEGSDLTVRGDRLYLKTLQGLQRVHGLIKRVDDEFVDPLELRADSTLGVAGLLQAVRAGQVVMANTPGSAFLESPALLGFLPALARHLLGEELSLPALPTWWCGERAVVDDALAQMNDCIIKPTYAGAAWRSSFEPVLGGSLSALQRDAWAGRILRHGDEHTLQAQLPLSQLPTWRSSAGGEDFPGPCIAPRSVMLRVYALADGAGGWRVLPGGMARLAGAGDATGVASMQRGGSTADVWVRSPGAVDSFSMLPVQPAWRVGSPHKAPVQRPVQHVTSRAAENLFWLGRYTERAENALRLARLTLQALNGGDQTSGPLLQWLGAMAVDNGLVLEDVPGVQQARRVFERCLIDSLAQADSGSLGSSLHAMRQAASGVRERFSAEVWNIVQQAVEGFFLKARAGAAEGVHSAGDALHLLDATSVQLAAVTGGQNDRMSRDDGWRLLSVGRHVERLAFLSSALLLALETGAVNDDAGFEGVLAVFDSTVTFHAQYQQARDLPALVDLLVMDRDNTRSLAWVVQLLRGRLARVAAGDTALQSVLALAVPDPDGWDYASLCSGAGLSPTGQSMIFHRAEPGEASPGDVAPGPAPLPSLLDDCNQAAYALSDAISAVFFSHSSAMRPSVER